MSSPSTFFGRHRGNMASVRKIIAKVYRDNLMKEYSKIYPNFLFEKNKGYPTKAHLNILKSLGSTKEHRKSFKPVIDVT